MVKKNLLGFFVLISMTSVILLVFLLPIDVEGLEGTARNIFFHVSMSITATVAFLMTAWYGIQYLIKKNLDDSMKLYICASLGFLYSILSVVTGSFWARFTWGEFWHWDPRQTASFILLLIYGALLVLRGAIEDEEKSAKVTSLYAVFSVFPMIFFTFVLPRMLPGLHPGSDEADFNPAVSSTTDLSIRLLLYASWCAFLGLFYWIFKLKCRTELLAKNYD